VGVGEWWIALIAMGSDHCQVSWAGGVVGRF